MDLSFFIIFLFASAFLLVVGWLSKNQIPFALGGLMLLFSGVALAQGIQYDCGSTQTTNTTTTNYYNGTLLMNATSNSTIANSTTYCTWKWNTDASNGVTFNTAFAVLLMLLFVYVLFSAFLEKR